MYASIIAIAVKAGLSNEEEEVEYTEKGYNDNNDEKYTDKQEVLSKLTESEN